MALLESITVGVLAAQWIYHRWKDSREPLPTVGEVMAVPKTEEGTTVPIVMGRVRIDRPVIVWSGNLKSGASPYRPDLPYYEGNVLFVLGIPFPDGNTLLQGIYVRGQRKTNGPTFPSNFAPNLNSVTGNDNVAGPLPSTRPDFVQIVFEYADGRSTQDMAISEAATRMAMAGIQPQEIPGFRGYATFLALFSINSVEIPAMAFELSTYPTGLYFTGFFGPVTIGDEVNPAHAIAAILCDPFGKLGLGAGIDILDQGSFARAAATLRSEGNGWSRCWDAGTPANEMIDEILRQIDGILYVDPSTGLYVLKLIRADYDPASLLHIGPSNCERLEGLTLTNGAGAPNRIVVKYPDRGQEYRERTTVAFDQASAFAGEEREQTLSYPGCHTYALANKLAARELAARSRSLLTCSAIVDRSFWNIRPGDVVRLSWPASYVSNVVMRVANVHRGGPADNTMRLDLIQDTFFVYRGKVQPPNLTPGFPDSASL